MPDIQFVTHVEGHVVLRTPEVDGPRGWGEGAVHYVDMQKHDDKHVLVDYHGGQMLVSEELLKAALGLLRRES